jgi:hypothetical protein
LKIVRSISASAAAILTLDISNFRPSLDGFIVIYFVRSAFGVSHSPHADDDDDMIGTDAGTPAFIDAVTYPGQ